MRRMKRVWVYEEDVDKILRYAEWHEITNENNRVTFPYTISVLVKEMKL